MLHNRAHFPSRWLIFIAALGAPRCQRTKFRENINIRGARHGGAVGRQEGRKRRGERARVPLGCNVLGQTFPPPPSACHPRYTARLFSPGRRDCFLPENRGNAATFFAALPFEISGKVFFFLPILVTCAYFV